MNIYLVTKDGKITPRKKLKDICTENKIVPATVHYQFRRQGYYDKNGIRIEKKQVV